MFLFDVAINEVANEIAKLNPKKCFGVYGLCPKIIRCLGNYISEPLSHIYKLTFSTDVIPEELKISFVTSVFKVGDITKFPNYMPISVLTCFSKILEKLMYKRLIDYIEKKKKEKMRFYTNINIGSEIDAKQRKPFKTMITQKGSS